MAAQKSRPKAARRAQPQPTSQNEINPPSGIPLKSLKANTAKKRSREPDTKVHEDLHRKKKSKTDKVQITSQPPLTALHVYVFGEGGAGELGLGAGKKTKDVTRPRLNPILDQMSVVQIVAGGMHALALTKDNKILSWGVNDDGALGRDTDWEGRLKDMQENGDDESDADNDESGLNPKESTPTAVDFSTANINVQSRFVQVAAGDSISLALTDSGRVYGWGTFRSNEGGFGFSPDVDIARRPQLINNLTGITSIAAGANHALALDRAGRVFAWGSGQQCQLGRRLINGRGGNAVKRKRDECLTPQEVRFSNHSYNNNDPMVRIDSGSYHSFAVTKMGRVYSWGLNNFGQTGHMKNAGTDDAVITPPALVKSITEAVAQVAGGSHHSVAATHSGSCLAFGRADLDQTGLPKDQILQMSDELVIRDQQGNPRIVAPVALKSIQGRVTFVAANSDHNIVIADSKAWAWGFSGNYQTGLGTDDDVPEPRMIDNTAVRNVKLTGSAAGGQFGMVWASK